MSQPLLFPLELFIAGPALGQEVARRQRRLHRTARFRLVLTVTKFALGRPGFNVWEGVTDAVFGLSRRGPQLPKPERAFRFGIREYRLDDGRGD